MEGHNLYGWTSCPLVAKLNTKMFCRIFDLVLTYFTTDFSVPSAAASVPFNIYSQW